MPGHQEILTWLRQFESRTGYEMDYSIERLACKLQGLSFAEVEDFGLDVVRRAVLSQPKTDMKSIVRDRLSQLGGRVREPASS